MIYRNGDTYDGEWKDNLEDGKGVYTFKNGTVYDGDFVEGKKEGKGTYTWADGFEYEGDMVQGEMEGEGKLTWPQEGYDIGLEQKADEEDEAFEERCKAEMERLVENYKHDDGEPIYVIEDDEIGYARCRVYEGEFTGNTSTGKGIIRFPDGMVYDGELFCGMFGNPDPEKDFG